MATDPQDLIDALTGNLYGSESEAIDGWVDAFVSYMSEAEAGGVPIEAPALLGAPSSSMRAGLAGLSTAGALAIQTGIQTFWTALAASPALYFPGATLITPAPGLSAIAADIEAIAPLNVSEKNDAQTALGYLVNGRPPALGLHARNLAGATVTFPGPIVSPIL